MTTQRVVRRQRGQSAYSMESPGAAIIGGGHRIGFAEQTADQLTTSTVDAVIPGMLMTIIVPNAPFWVGYRVPVTIETSGQTAPVGLVYDNGVAGGQLIQAPQPLVAPNADARHVNQGGLWLPSGILPSSTLVPGDEATFWMRWRTSVGTSDAKLVLNVFGSQIDACQMWAITG